MNVVMVGPFGMRPRTTMRVRALPMAKALVGRGHSVTMILPPWQNPEDAGRRWEEGGVIVENISLPPHTPGLFHAATALRLTRGALSLRPDVVHLFKPKAYSGLTHWLLARVPRARRPWLVVDTDDWEGPGGWNELGDYTWPERRFFAWQERWGLTHADSVTAASRMLESLAWAMGVSRDRVFYVPNGVGEDQACSRVRCVGNESEGAGREGSSACILLYTRFFEFPVSRVIDVLRRVQERVPDARLLVVGEGLFGEEEELFRLAAQSGLTVASPSSHDGQTRPCADASQSTTLPDITYAGWVPARELPSTLAEATVAIYPFDDTLVNRAKCAVKLRDLLVAGLPVVAESVGQNREYIRDGETGLLIDPGNVAAFADAVVQVLKNPALGERLGQAASRDVRERFAWEKLVEDVEQAYQRERS
ncbi:MAG: glycosyltransferase family 4 protein [Anaerolineae bacterium]